MIWLGIGIFFGVHLVPSFPEQRERLVERLGANGYKGAYSLTALAGLALIIVGYAGMDYHEIWETPAWASQVAFAVMPVVLILQVAAEVKGHIRKKIKHPMIVGVLMWALVHLLNNGDRASLYLFGAFAVFSIFSIISSTRRGKLPDYAEPNLKHDVVAVVFGLILFAAILWAHEFLFGVSPAF
jgi:uncharacterized membrane protein